MVSSGLVDRVDVSHFRLSLHLVLAFVILSLILYNYLKCKEFLNSQEKINQVSLRYIIRDEEDSIVEAVTFPISGAGGDYLSQGEVVIFKFFVRSDPKNIFNKELNLDYNWQTNF